MKKQIIILGLTFLSLLSCANAYQKVYLNKQTQTIYPTILRPVYNPYSLQYKNPYQYRRYNSNNIRRIQRLQKIRKINRLKRLSNFLTWNHNGKLTGYSVPINQDIYQQMGLSPWESDFKKKSNSPTCNTDLFSTPSGNEMYYNDGRFIKDLGGTQGKTGVTIIYD